MNAYNKTTSCGSGGGNRLPCPDCRIPLIQIEGQLQCPSPCPSPIYIRAMTAKEIYDMRKRMDALEKEHRALKEKYEKDN